MTTLADLILASPHHRRLLAAPGRPGDAAGPPATIPVVVADAAAEFFFAGTAQEFWEFGRDLADCTPPASPIFVEMTRPSRIVSATRGLNDPVLLPARWGWRFEATGRDRLAAELRHPGRGPALLHHYRSYVDALAGSGRVDLAAVAAALEAPDPLDAARGLGGPDGGYFAAARIVRELDGLGAGAGGEGRGELGRLLHGSLLIEVDGRALGPVATLDLILDHAGRPAPPPLVNVHGGGLPPAFVGVLRATILSMTFPAMLALSLLNTPGATLRDVEPTAELARRHAERGQPAPVRCQALEIAEVIGVDRN